MTPIKIPPKPAGEKYLRTDYDTGVAATNSKVFAQHYVLTGVSAVSTIPHGVGTAMSWTMNQFRIVGFVTDATGFPVAGFRLDPSTADIVSLIFSGDVAVPFTGEIDLIFYPL